MVGEQIHFQGLFGIKLKFKDDFVKCFMSNLRNPLAESKLSLHFMQFSLCWRRILFSLRRPTPSTSLCRRFYYPMGETAAGGKAKPNSSSAPPTYTKDEAYLQTIIPKRIALFQSIQNEQNLARLALSPDLIR